MKSGKIFILSGPSGSGKTTLYKKLLASKDFSRKLVKSVSVTTRSKRPKERHGKDYIFVSLRMFQYKKGAGHFLESERVFNNLYGTPRKSVRDLLRKGKNVLLCIDVMGAKTVRRKLKNTISIFVKPPNITILKKRLTKRGSEQEDVVNLRLKRVKKELSAAKDYDYIVVNRDLNRVFTELKNVIKSELA